MTCSKIELDAAFHRGYVSGAASRDAEIAELKVVSDHNLATYHQAAELLRAERDQLREQLEASRANDRTAMLYLSEIKSAAGHDGDFPSLVLKVAELREQVTLLTKTVEYAKHQCESMRVWGGMCWTYHPLQAGRIFNKCEEAIAATEPKP